MQDKHRVEQEATRIRLTETLKAALADALTTNAWPPSFHAKYVGRRSAHACCLSVWHLSTVGVTAGLAGLMCGLY